MRAALTTNQRISRPSLGPSLSVERQVYRKNERAVQRIPQPTSVLHEHTPRPPQLSYATLPHDVSRCTDPEPIHDDSFNATKNACLLDRSAVSRRPAYDQLLNENRCACLPVGTRKHKTPSLSDCSNAPSLFLPLSLSPSCSNLALPFRASPLLR